MVYLSIDLLAAGDGCRLFYLADDIGPCTLGYGPCWPYDTVLYQSISFFCFTDPVQCVRYYSLGQKRSTYIVVRY